MARTLPIGDVDRIINHLKEMKNVLPDRYSNLCEMDCYFLIRKAKTVFLEQPMLLEIPAPVKVCGNILGSLKDLLRIFEIGGHPPEANYLFLGDYVDRGHHSVEVISLLLAYKIKYPNNFFMLRGHHECERVNWELGFYHECSRRFNDNLWFRFVNLFNCMPIAAVIGHKIFCCHGGLSPDLHSLDQIKQIPRPIDVPTDGLMYDLLYANPSENVVGWRVSPHDASLQFGKDVVDRFLKQFNFDLIVRAHQVIDSGYEFFADNKLLTIFSVTNFYESGNHGALLTVDDNFRCSFEILESRKKLVLNDQVKRPCFFPGGDGKS